MPDQIAPAGALPTEETVTVPAGTEPSGKEELDIEAAKRPGLGAKGRLLGLYQGIPLKDRTHYYGMVMPDKITLYKQNIERSCEAGGSNIREEIKHVIAGVSVVQLRGGNHAHAGVRGAHPITDRDTEIRSRGQPVDGIRGNCQGEINLFGVNRILGLSTERDNRGSNVFRDFEDCFL